MSANLQILLITFDVQAIKICGQRDKLSLKFDVLTDKVVRLSLIPEIGQKHKQNGKREMPNQNNHCNHFVVSICTSMPLIFLIRVSDRMSFIFRICE